MKEPRKQFEKERFPDAKTEDDYVVCRRLHTYKNDYIKWLESHHTTPTDHKELEESLPDFLYLDNYPTEGTIRIGWHGDSVVNDEWEEWKTKFAQSLKSEWISCDERLPE